MKIFSVALALACLSFIGATEEFRACYTPPTAAIDCVEISPRPDVYLDDSEVADHWDWRDIQSNGVGKDMTTAVLNQHIPRYCGACWAFGTLSALSDRIKIRRNARWPEVILSPQVLLNCGKHKGYDVGCDGGFAHATYSYVHKFGITDITCAAYQAKDLSCTAEHVCQTCSHDLTCSAVKKPSKYYVKEYGQVSGEKAMQKEIQERGPIACGIAVNKALLDFKGGEVFHDKTNTTKIRHVISIVGWGVSDAGEKYWIVRNSWGSYYADQGYFKIVRGINNMNLESDCYWAVPKFDEEQMERGAATRTLREVSDLDTRENQQQQSADDDSSEFDFTPLMKMDDLDLDIDKF